MESQKRKNPPIKGSWSKRPHSKTATPKTATTLLATKTATTKTATLYWSKRPHREDHYQNGQTAFGQNGHKGRITTKTATLHLVKTATKGGSLPKRPHCIWSKRPHRKDHYQNGHTAFGQNGHTGRGITGSLARHQSRTRVCLLACSRAHFSGGTKIRNDPEQWSQIRSTWTLKLNISAVTI